MAAIVIWYFVSQNKSNNEPAQQDAGDNQVDLVKEGEDAIVKVQTLAALQGVQSKTEINSLIDKCVKVHESLASVDRTEVNQLHSVPGDFSRLIEIHLPELITKFGQLGDAVDQAAIEKFNGVLEQLHGELDQILKNIETRNYVAFASKQAFMEIRYSDKF